MSFPSQVTKRQQLLPCAHPLSRTPSVAHTGGLWKKRAALRESIHSSVAGNWSSCPASGHQGPQCNTPRGTESGQESREQAWEETLPSRILGLTVVRANTMTTASDSPGARDTQLSSPRPGSLTHRH